MSCCGTPEPDPEVSKTKSDRKTVDVSSLCLIIFWISKNRHSHGQSHQKIKKMMNISILAAVFNEHLYLSCAAFCRLSRCQERNVTTSDQCLESTHQFQSLK